MELAQDPLEQPLDPLFQPGDLPDEAPSTRARITAGREWSRPREIIPMAMAATPKMTFMGSLMRLGMWSLMALPTLVPSSTQAQSRMMPLGIIAKPP